MAYGSFSKTQDAKSIMNDNHKPPKLHHIHIEPMTNGAVVEAHHQKPPQKGKDGAMAPIYDGDCTKTSTAFTDPDQAGQHVADLLSHHMKHYGGGKVMPFGGKESAAEEKAEGE